MFVAIQIIAGMAFFSALYFLARRGLHIYRRYSGKMRVTCPENRQPAAVEVDARHAALTAAFYEENLMLKACSRWPEMENCGQDCLSQIERAHDDCHVRTLLTNWFQGKQCVFCRKKFHDIQWHDHKPALLTPEKKLLEWQDIPVLALPDVLKTHSPVCWDCFIAETFRQKYPELVLDRPADRKHAIH